MTALDALALAASALTAAVGLFVAYQAYRGYRRNGSDRMYALAVGVVFLAVVPYALVNPVAAVLDLADAQALVAALLSHTVGLLAVYRSLD